ncbi:hypothetical protein [Marinilabilia rubra]|uniref:Outer membrane protein beta-barrel domain-containing protein n=1 Tax=Marinilabilia rubra TaxID=2162893 RepID=A0A2U2BA57_9BACT|nr:hypothetical protein [Marinilabilia rubra]PWD99955.1 hypothetical protein DDZ16_08700 [Marinilabilia rubra]
MIRYSVLLFLFFCIVASLHGQYRGDAWILSPKISFADYSDQSSWEDYSISKVPPVSVFLEKGITDYFSAGGFIGYNGDKYTNDTIPDNVMRYNTITTGAVATIHYAHWLEALSGHSIFLGDFDFYVSGALQVAFKNTNEQHSWNAETETFDDNKSSDAQIRIRPIFGIRYFLTERFCMLFEAGKGNAGMITTGVSWNLY